jgi:AcrR family transcriptional regulator
MKGARRAQILGTVLRLMDSRDGADAVTLRAVARSIGITPMAIYKHFPDRDALLEAATAAEYDRIGGYFKRANARAGKHRLRGMLGYLDYACDHPQLFRYMFAGKRKGAFAYPGDLESDKSPTLNLLHQVVADLMQRRILAAGDVFETSLTIWAHAHGLVALYLNERIQLPRRAFRDLYLRSLDRLVDGLKAS